MRRRVEASSRALRSHGLLRPRRRSAHGASPRATIALALGARAAAFLDGRPYVTPDDVRSVALDVLRHRVGVTYEAEAEEVTADQIVQRVLDKVPVP